MARGFEEKQSEYLEIGEEPPKFASMERERVIVGKGGRLVIPARMRKAMGIKEGDTMVARVDEGELVAVPLGVAIKKVQENLKHLKRPGESIVDEFIADRRREAELE